MTGGYKIIDLYGLDLANMQLDSTKIEEIFNDIESTYQTKALLFDNYKINGIEQNATFSSAVFKNGGFEITLGDYKVLIKNDSVTDSTLHLYRHDLSLELTFDNDESTHGRCTLYNIDNSNITTENLKNFIADTSRTGILAASNTSTSGNMISLYYDDNNYYAHLNIDDDYLITTISILDDAITKIF